MSESLIDRIVAFPKYQEGDFQPHPSSPFLRKYSCPEYAIHFPAGVDSIREMVGWESFGYRVGPSRGFCVGQESHVLTIYGDIPDFLRERLEVAGARVELVHARGDRVIDL